jgi:hypothetical protein
MSAAARPFESAGWTGVHGPDGSYPTADGRERKRAFAPIPPANPGGYFPFCLLKKRRSGAAWSFLVGIRRPSALKK